MVIELHKQEILNDLRSKSHYEVSQIDDAEARYKVEAGTEKMDEVNRCISEAASRLNGRCRRFLRDYQPSYVVDAVFSPDSFVIDLAISERRAINKESIAEAMHTFVVEYALSKFYVSMSQQELSNKHSLLAVDAGNLIDELLYTKLPPLV